jgi:hypothetical protein
VRIDGGPVISRSRGEKEPRTATNSSPRSNRFAGPAILLAAACIAIAPLLWYGPARGGDFGFHFVSWIDARQAMLSGVPYPHWAYSPNFGAGEPRFIFYPPISWMAGAILGMFLPWSFVPLALSILLLTATGLATRALARATMADGPATLAGCAAIFLSYALFNVYKRCDYAELAAGALIPVLLLFALRRRNPSGSFWARAFDGSAAPLALTVAGIWLSNGPVGIMALYLLAAVALFSALLEKSLVPIVRAAAATCVGLALASLYLIPAIFETRWASIPYAFTLSHFVVENSWLFARHADPDMFSHDVLLLRVSIVAAFMLVVTFAGGAIAWMRGALPGPRRWWLPLALIPPVVLFLLLPVSLPVWNLMPTLRLLQFPWRWLVVLEAPMAIAFASAVWFDRKTVRIAVLAACAALFVGISGVAFHWWFLESKSFEADIQESIREGAGVLGKPEYAPPGIQMPQMDRPVADACLLDPPMQPETGSAPVWDGDSATCNSSSWHEVFLLAAPSHSNVPSYMHEQKQIMGVAGHPGFLILRLRYYPAWRVTVNGIRVTPRAEQSRGLIAVSVPQGTVQVLVDWTTTGDVVAGRLVSFAALFLVAGMFAFERKRLRPTHEPGLQKPAPAPSTPSAPTGNRNQPSPRKPQSARRK